ncbi:LacI family DNA-binding transcriptional regulator [Streptomyces globisporus]|uniref:LacI family DNA-binding transcriptional regulator n=1 Tax=Streptomyces globisporus TaxID=1908 RepID=UPI0036A32573
MSNVARHAPQVSDATRVRVMEAVGELGYRPNTSARLLRTGHSGPIAFAVPNLTTPHFADPAHHVARDASGRGLTVLIEETRGDARGEPRLATGVGASQLDSEPGAGRTRYDIKTVRNIIRISPHGSAA